MAKTRVLASQLKEKVSKVVQIKGWIHSRRAHGKINFIDVRDRSGLAQVVVLPDSPASVLAKIPLESCVAVKGVVSKRPQAMVNSKIVSGEVELHAQAVKIYSKAKTPPFSLSETSSVQEETRLKYRYLDLRSRRMRKNLFFRHQVYQFTRKYLANLGFWEVTTPNFTRSTPEGARDFLVPSRNHPGKFYALPQSPQQYKQILMVAGVEKYFQIATCFRDEDTRQDRQPEFTQVDIEVAFASQKKLIQLVEKMVTELVKKLALKKLITLTPFPTLTYKQAIKRYGTDSPDLRKNKKDKNELAFVWITDFPMFEKKQDGTYSAQHHPFTRIQREYLDDFEKNPDATLAYQFDLVLNGNEIAGGGLRTYKPEILARVFEFLGLSKTEVREQFGHLLEAFEYGVPPHGGIALGLERFLALVRGQKSIREMIPFPKTGDGYDPLMNSPSTPTPEQLKELSLKINPRPK